MFVIMSKINLVLDLDNTLISSISTREMKKIKSIDKRKLQYKDMDSYYRVFYRPHLKEFLDYAFENFNVTVWTAASRDYAAFIIDNILLNTSSKNTKGTRKKQKTHPTRQLKMFFYDDNCDQSQDMYDKESPKDLKYLYHFDGYHPCNTIIIDDLYEVYQANPKQTIRAVYFDAKKEVSEKDTFLLDAMKRLEEIKEQYEKSGCTLHKH